jgi:hypothetical protein
VHFGSVAPAFTLSLSDSEFSRKPPMRLALVVRGKRKKKERNGRFLYIMTLILSTTFYDKKRKTDKVKSENNLYICCFN